MRYCVELLQLCTFWRVKLSVIWLITLSKYKQSLFFALLEYKHLVFMGDIIIAWACLFYLLFRSIIVVRRLIKYRMLLIFFYPYGLVHGCHTELHPMILHNYGSTLLICYNGGRGYRPEWIEVSFGLIATYLMVLVYFEYCDCVFYSTKHQEQTVEKFVGTKGGSFVWLCKKELIVFPVSNFPTQRENGSSTERKMQTERIMC